MLVLRTTSRRHSSCRSSVAPVHRKALLLLLELHHGRVLVLVLGHHGVHHLTSNTSSCSRLETHIHGLVWWLLNGCLRNRELSAVEDIDGTDRLLILSTGLPASKIHLTGAPKGILLLTDGCSQGIVLPQWHVVHD